MSAHPLRVAVVDLGTNTTRLLVADVLDGTVSELERRTTITRLGEGVDASGRLAAPAIERVFRALAEYREQIDVLGAQATVAVATSAMRDAENGPELRDGIRDEFGIDARTISGDEEARLTFLGATSERTPSDRAALVIDIGGGSTELVVGVPGRDPDFHVSTQAGAVRQTERHLLDDPPIPEQVSDMALEVQLIIEEGAPADVRARVDFAIAVAGTATSMAAIEQELDPYDPARIHGYRLELGACERILAMLAGQTLEQRRDVTGLHPDRAPTIVAGAVILIEAMRAFGLEWVETSEADILHGAALTAAA
jgi:exopolyphosphatase / guanosine-5'-triphosphate,3'-diphosphate pyrophosphatase